MDTINISTRERKLGQIFAQVVIKCDHTKTCAKTLKLLLNERISGKPKSTMTFSYPLKTHFIEHVAGLLYSVPATNDAYTNAVIQLDSGQTISSLKAEHSNCRTYRICTFSPLEEKI